ncbi:hypothetical protein [Marinobacter sp. DS40M6]|uniref:hypothetical protein n=1 Tax=Marinobacter sp. DS40M6 TaxID=1597776 RepID=UPI0023597E9D|nr:hypothetical protein [Marinobacter sp. DS40M6]MDC8456893.1 hypothetical protein [Marinobacter sp. DS40M6]
MQNQAKPTAAELLISWQLIWTRLLNGKPGELKQALNSHAKLFPAGNQAEARIRAERTVAQYQNEPAQVRNIINRTKHTLRSA